ncbi:mannitol dehydrogenase family protein [Labrys monachus]|uniref:Fructuronate reductase n=1 Tax=Labrys monachus TaxID=217067 RepID=A0ABU0FBR0_9HYPH|nr:mannitol dehydrogenase family protein [Labrys monachus]MDQ0391986.1 fructuronate reductase [Labrys monachus]
MQRLTASTLHAVPADIRRPCYDRERLAVGMAHIGVGAFHRCHQADYTDDMLEARFGPWGVVGINLHPPRLAGPLGAQDGLYTRTLREGGRAETRVIGSIRRVIDAQDAAGAEAAIAALASPAVRAVTMTVTEKGYCHVPASGALDWSNPQLCRDRDGAGVPGTVLGLLAAAFERRRAAGAPGLTVISCDNVPANGALLHAVLAAFLDVRSPPLAAWMEVHVAFPSTMVDRIAPAPTEADRAFAAERTGLIDEAAVVGEPFRQWVIDDRFIAERPPWDLAGAQFVADVTPYELIKMRVLNAAQSTLSHLGAILGHDFSFEAASDPLLSALTRRMLERETATTLPDVPGMAADAYIATSMARIANPAIRHRCHQIGTDGSQKIVQRLVNPLRERLAAGHAPGLLALAVASWLAYALCGARRFGARWVPDDPLAPRVVALGEEAGGDFEALARALLGIGAIFGTDLAASPACAAIARHLEGLLSVDPRSYLAGVAHG